MQFTTNIKGAKAVEKALMNASDKLTRKVILSGMRAAATPIVKAVKSYTPVSKNTNYDNRKRGDLKKSIGKFTGKSKKFATLYVGPRVKNKFAYMGYIGHWIEFGNDTGYDLAFKGRRYVQKGYESAQEKALSILDEKILKAATKFLK